MNQTQTPTGLSFSVVTADTIFETLEGLGVKPWQRIADPVPLAEYMKRELTEAERGDLRFAQKAEVVFLEQPNGKPYTGFRTIGKNWATVFSVIPGEPELLPIIGEFKHGAEDISLAFPSGVPGKAEADIADPLQKMAACGMREFQEETGLKLKTLHPLCGPGGLPMSTRQSTERSYPFLGTLAIPLVIGPTKLDATEHLKMVLIAIPEWLKLIDQGKVEGGIVAATFLGLRATGRL